MRVYETPAEEFLLERVELGRSARLASDEGHSVECLIVIDGAADLASQGQTLRLTKGRAALVPAGIPYLLTADQQGALFFRARVPR